MAPIVHSYDSAHTMVMKLDSSMESRNGVKDQRMGTDEEVAVRSSYSRVDWEVNSPICSVLAHSLSANRWRHDHGSNADPQRDVVESSLALFSVYAKHTHLDSSRPQRSYVD